ncbi:MAG: four helix bundle protein [Bacteroidota bacterium]
MATHNYKELKIWLKSRILVKQVYQITSAFPKTELYGITSQARRSAVSIPSNIAEGAGRGTDKDFSHFLDIAKGSVFELETLLILASDLNFASEGELQKVMEMTSEIKKMLSSFQDKLNNPKRGTVLTKV